MANNVVLRENLAADAIVDDDSETIWFVSVLHGAGAPASPPPVPDKDWIYVNTSASPKAGYLWNSGAAAWQAFGAAGTPTEGWALEGNAADGDDVLGTTNNQDLRLIVNGDQVIVAESTDGSVRVQPGGVSSLLTSGPTQQLFIGPTHPETATGPCLIQGDLDDPTTEALQFIRLGAASGPQRGSELGVYAGDMDVALVGAELTDTGALAASIQGQEGDRNSSVSVTTAADGVNLTAAVDDVIYATARLVAGSGGDDLVFLAEVIDPASTLGGQTIRLTLGGLLLDNFVTEPDGTTEVGSGTNLASDLIARRREATALFPAGMYLESLPRTTVIELIVSDPTTEVVTGDGQLFFTVPEKLDDYVVTDVQASVPGAVSSSGAVSVQVARVRSATPADVLSTLVTIDASEATSYTAATPSVVNASNDGLQTGDFLRVDVDGAGTGAQGLQVIITLQAP